MLERSPPRSMSFPAKEEVIEPAKTMASTIKAIFPPIAVSS